MLNEATFSDKTSSKDVWGFQSFVENAVDEGFFL